MKDLMGLLCKTAEEAGEFTQASMKMREWGPDSKNPKDSKTNRRALMEEAGDMLACIRVLVQAGLIDGTQLKRRAKGKTKFYTRRYLEESK